jgi:hypothetical protein
MSWRRQLSKMEALFRRRKAADDEGEEQRYVAMESG